MANSDSEPLIKPNSSLQDYYASLESRIGYRLLLGGTRHFGYWERDTWWPFPINRSLRAMEDHLFNTLHLEKGAAVLDAGCGIGAVAIHLAGRGLRVTGIDVVERHIRRAKRNVSAAGQESAVSVRKMDYHDLSGLTSESFAGAYTMETFVHATEPEVALAEFFRILQPGGVLALYEYDHHDLGRAPAHIQTSMGQINQYAAMPGNARFEAGVLEELLVGTGFQDVVVRDLSVNITPMLRLFFVLAYVPFLVVSLLGLEKYFINTVAAVRLYKSRDYCRYVAVSARKPSAGQDAPGDGLRERKK